MEIYLYCSYEQSQKGFCLTKIEGDSLVPCSNAPEIIGEFFYYDRYQVLWRDIPGELQPNKRQIAASGSFFGLRGLKGRIQGGRWGNANIAFWVSDPEEIPTLRRIAMGILGNVDAFTVLLLQQLSIGGESGYLLDVPVVQRYLDTFTRSTRLKLLDVGSALSLLPFLQRKEDAQTPEELVRLAVGSDLADLTAKKRFLQRSKPQPLLTPEQFHEIFSGHGALWELYSADPLSSPD